MFKQSPILDALQTSIIVNRKDHVGQTFWTEWRTGLVLQGGTTAQAGDLAILGPDGKFDPSVIPGSTGSTVSVNGNPVADPNFNDTTPAAPMGYTNVLWQYDISGNVSAYYATSGTTLPFGEILTGTNTDAVMTVSGTAVLQYSDTGVVNANEIGGIGVAVNTPTHEGQVLISQPGNATAAWADPQVQGLYPDGSSIASPPVYAPPTTIQPVYVGGQGLDGNLYGIKVSNDGTVQIVGDVSVSSLPAITGSVSVSNFPATQTISGTVNIGTMPNVTIANFPATQTVTGSVTVSNLPLPTIFKTISAAASGSTPVWTPTSGKKFRLQRLIVYVTLNATLTIAGVETITFYDGATPMPLIFDVYLNQTGSFTEAWTSGWLDFGNGIISSTINNVLNVNLSTVLATGNIRVIVCGVEE